MGTERMALPRPTKYWNRGEVETAYEHCDSAMKFVDNTPPNLVSEKYRNCLKRGREVIIENMIEMILCTGYFKPQHGVSKYVMYWRDVPQCIAKFVQHLETVFTADKVFKLRKKKVSPAVRLATSAAGDVPFPKHTEDWSEEAIKLLYDECQCAMKLLENNSAIISGKYRQCLQRGRNTIIEKIMEFIMDTEYFMKHESTESTDSTELQVHWPVFPRGLARFLQHIETVFTGNEELQIREKVWRKKIAIPSIASLVALVEAPEPGQKSGILRSYGQMQILPAKYKLEVLRGKRILNEKWAEDGENYKLSGEAKAMLCMHLWSLMRYVGFSKPEKIWEGISKGWPECVVWKEGSYGNFWTNIIQSDQVALRVHVENKGMKTILDAYKEMERFFKEDSGHFLIHYEDAYYSDEDNPYHSY